MDINNLKKMSVKEIYDTFLELHSMDVGQIRDFWNLIQAMVEKEDNELTIAERQTIGTVEELIVEVIVGILKVDKNQRQDFYALVQKRDRRRNPYNLLNFFGNLNPYEKNLANKLKA